nr:hypothetical protein [Chloroflexia bacterium]
MDSPSPSATPPRRLFRLGRAADPLAPLAGPPDALFAGTAIVLCSTRRGAFVEALAPPASAVGPTGLPSDVIAVALRFVDPRPLLDLRSPLDPAVLQRLAVEVSAHAGRLPLSLARELG